MTAPGSNARVAFGLLRWAAHRDPAGEPAVEQLPRPSLEFLRQRGIDSLYWLASGVTDHWQEAYDGVWQLQRAAFREVLEALDAAGVRTLSFKGAELVGRYYGAQAIGFNADLDLLTPRVDVERARAVLYQLGFRHAYWDAEERKLLDRDVQEVADVELRHYELAPFLRAHELAPASALSTIAERHDRQPLVAGPDGPVVLIEVDLHHNVATDADPEPFFTRAVPSSFGCGETFSPADHVWFNLTRLYNEVALHDKLSLRPLAYTLPVIASGEVRWEDVVSAADQLSLGPTLSYYLAFCDRLAPGCIPGSTLHAVAASTTSRARDWGWQLGKLFDFEEEFPLQAFSLDAPGLQSPHARPPAPGGSGPHSAPAGSVP